MAPSLLARRFPARADQVRLARREVEACAREHGAVDPAGIALAVSEAVTNAVIHAYRDRAADAEPGRVRLTLEADGQGLLIAVDDDGVGMSPRPDSPGFGVGLPLIANVCDDLEIHQRADGTSVRMRFRLTDTGPPSGRRE
jgi:stage II sporulation protein AB (anti-sigma F factor)